MFFKKNKMNRVSSCNFLQDLLPNDNFLSHLITENEIFSSVTLFPKIDLHLKIFCDLFILFLLPILDLLNYYSYVPFSKCKG